MLQYLHCLLHVLRLFCFQVFLIIDKKDVNSDYFSFEKINKVVLTHDKNGYDLTLTDLSNSLPYEVTKEVAALIIGTLPIVP